MAKLTVTIPDAKVDEVMDVLSKRFGWTEEVEMMDGATPALIPNPAPKALQVTKAVINFLKVQYREAKADEAVLAHQNDLDDLS